MTIVNQRLPSVADFKKKVGRCGPIRMFRRADINLNNIFELLNAAQHVSALKGHAIRDGNDIKKLERLRGSCIKWLVENMGKKRFEREAVTTLGLHAHDNLIHFVCALSGPSSHTMLKRAKNKAASLAMDKRMTNPINGPILGKSLDPTYDVERFTSNHMPGPAVDVLVNNKFEQFNLHYPGNRLDIQDYIKLVLIPNSRADPHGVLLFGRRVMANGMKNLLKTVKYCSATERQDFKLNFPGNGIINCASGHPYHTGGMSTNKSGSGWCIFVVCYLQEFYAAPHVVNEFHHSSFLAGEPIFAAGEIAIDNGQVVGVTNKTGHYKAGPEELQRALLLLQRDAGVDLSKVAVNDPFKAPDIWYKGSDVVQAKGDFDNPTLMTARRVSKPTIMVPNV